VPFDIASRDGCSARRTARLPARVHRQLRAEEPEIEAGEMGKVITDRGVPEYGAGLFGQAFTGCPLRHSDTKCAVSGVVQFPHAISENEG